MKLTWKIGGVAVAAAAAIVVGTLSSPANAATFDPQQCTEAGHISYTINRAANPTPDQQSAYAAIDDAMKRAVNYYNCYVNVTKALSVSYEPSVPTADGSYNGSVRFGGRDYMQQITAMHEIAHTLGIGTAPEWASHVSGGAWTGANALQVLRTFANDQSAVLHADNLHFWPYGLNSEGEVQGIADVTEHCLLVVAMRKDMGL